MIAVEETPLPKFDLGQVVAYNEVVASQHKDSKSATIKHRVTILGIRYKGVGKYSGEVGYQYLINFKHMSIQDCPPNVKDGVWIDEACVVAVGDHFDD
jgi:hypothetical protein